MGNLNAWRATPGALAWLRGTGARRPKGPKVTGPTAAVKAKLAKLPQVADDVWQAETRRLPIWMKDGGEYVRPWILVVVSRTHDLILGQQVVEEPPVTELAFDRLAAAMTKPAMGRPHRPARVEVRSGPPWDALAGHLDDVGVALEPLDHLEPVDQILDQLVAHLCGRPPGPGLLDMPGVGTEQVASFYQAAADFYRAAPWQRVGGSETIEIACDAFDSGPWYAVVIGQMGMTMGVALYEDLDALMRMRDGNASDEQNARETVALSVTYGDQTEVPVPDLDASEEHGWEVAGPEAHPAPIRKERGMTMRPPLAWELQLLEATLRALPGFIAHHDRNDQSAEAVEVPTGSGPLTLRISWVTERPGT
jgi:hypothetical protein